MQTYTIHPMVVGINETDQGVMTYLRDYGKRIFPPPARLLPPVFTLMLPKPMILRKR